MSQDALLARLEAAVARLEALGTGSGPAKKTGDEMDDATLSGLTALTEYEIFSNEKIPLFLKAFEPFADLQEHKAAFEAAWANQHKLIKAQALCMFLFVCSLKDSFFIPSPFNNYHLSLSPSI